MVNSRPDFWDCFRFYKGESGNFQAEAKIDKYLLVASFLEEDIQGSSSLADEYIKKTVKILRGEFGSQELNGNAYGVLIGNDKSKLTNHFLENKELLLETSFFLKIITHWKDFITGDSVQAK